MNTSIIKHSFTALILFLFVTTIGVSSILTAVFWVDSLRCEALGEKLEKEVDYKMLTCYVKENGNWYTEKTYQQMLVARSVAENANH